MNRYINFEDAEISIFEYIDIDQKMEKLSVYYKDKKATIIT